MVDDNMPGPGQGPKVNKEILSAIRMLEENAKRYADLHRRYLAEGDSLDMFELLRQLTFTLSNVTQSMNLLHEAYMKDFKSRHFNK